MIGVHQHLPVDRAAQLLADAKLACDRARAAGADRVEGAVVGRLRARYRRLLADGQAANPPPPATGRRRGRARRSQPRPARPQAAPVDLVQAVVEAVARGELDDELAGLGAVINQRVRLLATTRSMRTLASLRVGDRVRINHSAKPNYLHGRAGTVSGWAGQKDVVQLDQPVGRFVTGELRWPPLATARPRAAGT